MDRGMREWIANEGKDRKVKEWTGNERMDVKEEPGPE